MKRRVNEYYMTHNTSTILRNVIINRWHKSLGKCGTSVLQDALETSIILGSLAYPLTCPKGGDFAFNTKRKSTEISTYVQHTAMLR